MVFLLCIFLVPEILMFVFGLDYYTSCGAGFVIGWIASFLVTKAIRSSQADPGQQQQTQYQPYGQRQTQDQYGYQGQPGAYQQQQTQQYDDRRYSATTGRGYATKTRVKSGSSFQAHVCKKCGGPVNLSTRSCDYCGARN